MKREENYNQLVNFEKKMKDIKSKYDFDVGNLINILYNEEEDNAKIMISEIRDLIKQKP